MFSWTETCSTCGLVPPLVSSAARALAKITQNILALQNLRKREILSSAWSNKLLFTSQGPFERLLLDILNLIIREDLKSIWQNEGDMWYRNQCSVFLSFYVAVCVRIQLHRSSSLSFFAQISRCSTHVGGSVLCSIEDDAPSSSVNRSQLEHEV